MSCSMKCKVRFRMAALIVMISATIGVVLAVLGWWRWSNMVGYEVWRLPAPSSLRRGYSLYVIREGDPAFLRACHVVLDTGSGIRVLRYAEDYSGVFEIDSEEQAGEMIDFFLDSDYTFSLLGFQGIRVCESPKKGVFELSPENFRRFRLEPPSVSFNGEYYVVRRPAAAGQIVYSVTFHVWPDGRWQEGAVGRGEMHYTPSACIRDLYSPHRFAVNREIEVRKLIRLREPYPWQTANLGEDPSRSVSDLGELISMSRQRSR